MRCVCNPTMILNSSISLQKAQATNSIYDTVIPMNKGPPPAWLQNWRQMVRRFRHVEMWMATMMVQAVRLGLRPRRWIQHQDPLDMELQEALLNKATKPCAHEKMHRYGNRSGSFAKCLMCEKKWKWSEDEDRWTDLASSKRQPLPLPSSSTASNFLDKARRPAWALMATSSTAPPPPGPPGPKALTGSKSSAETTSQGTATPLSTATRQPRGARPKNSSKKRSTPTEEVEEVESSEYEWEQIG